MISVYVNDIKKTIENECFFTALSLTLSLPDMCGLAEYPDKGVAERYISWFNKYVSPALGDDKPGIPYMSGEMVYNLRNTFLHQGSPSINFDKVKEDVNHVDRFALDLSSIPIYSTVIKMEYRGQSVTSMLINVVCLCDIICKSALKYYEANRTKFSFAIDVLPKDYEPKKFEGDGQADPVTQLFNKKLEESGQTVRIKSSILKGMESSVTKELTNKILEENYASTSEPKGREESANKDTQLSADTQKKDKQEHRIRCFFGKEFKDSKYMSLKEEIIAAVLESDTKMGLNNKLMKIMPGNDVKIVYARLKPFIKDRPGK